MTCKFRLEANGDTEITADTGNLDVCNATKILEQLHTDFTEKYTNNTVASNNTTKPSFYLRNQQHTSGGPNKFYTIFTQKTDADNEYKTAVSVIMKGVEDTVSATYMIKPTTVINNFDISTDFKGIYGLMRVNELLEQKIAQKVGALRGTPANANTLADASKYEQRKNIKTTYEEIARRENQIYREKFLNLLLIVVGIFIVSTQLVQKYFSFGGGGGGGGGGGSTGFFTGFGTSGSGLFSRFGGLGLGSSGRSRIGQLFSNNPYSLSQR
jgi:hypothetical protein